MFEMRRGVGLFAMSTRLMLAMVLAAGAVLLPVDGLLRPAAAETSSDEQKTVSVMIEGVALNINGQTTVPTGLLGVHAVSLTPEKIEEMGIEAVRQIHFSPSANVTAIGKDGQVKPMYRLLDVVIDCPGDRYHPATVLQRKDFAEFFEQMGRQYAQRCLDADYAGIVEFWNEPYLNWAERSRGSQRNNYHPRWYDVSQAREDGPVTIKGWDKPVKHLRWRRLWAADAKGKIYACIPVPAGAKPGDTFEAQAPADWYFVNRERQTFTVIEEWHPYDPTAVSWWSGRQNLDYYMWMFMPFARAVKQTNPNVTVIAGWDFGFSHGDWAVWRELYVPLIDEGIEYIDGVTDHHYGVDTRQVTAWYEVAAAYTKNKHDKWIKGYNTECGGRLDPAVHMDEANRPAEDSKARSRMAAATYLLRDVIELMYHSPGKSGSRTAHHIDDMGEGQALRLLKPLRGQLLRTSTSDNDGQVWVVGSYNSRDEMVAAVFNNATQPRTIRTNISAPPGRQLVHAEVRTLEVDQKADAPVIRSTRVKAAGHFETITRTLPARTAMVVVIPTRPIAEGEQETEQLKREADLAIPAVGSSTLPTASRTQFFAREGVLHDVKPGQHIDLTIPVDKAMLHHTARRMIQVTLQNASGEEVKIKMNGRDVRLEDTTWTVRQGLPEEHVEPTNRLRFSCPEDGDGYRVCVASIILEHADDQRLQTYLRGGRTR